MAVTVYSKPNCVQCTATYRALDKAGVTYQIFDLTQNPEAMTKLLAHGYQQAPVVWVNDTTHWSGFRPDLIKQIKETA